MAQYKYRKQLVSNTIWNTIERFAVLGIQLLCTFILARFLTPSDFGIIGMVVVFTTIANTLIDSGFSQALIREDVVSKIEYSSVFYVNIAIAFIIYVILFLCSEYIALFFHQPILNDICKVTFLVIPCNALCLVQNTILIRNLQFKKLCIISIIASLLSSVIAIVMAFHIKNVWVLVIHNLLIYFFKAIGLWISTSWYPALKFSMNLINRLFKFSRNLLISGFIGNIFNNIYSVLIGHYYTATDLGFYSQADRIKNIASHNSTQVIQNVTYPILAKINNEGSDIKEAYRKIIIITVIFVGGVVTMLMCVSLDLLVLFMGNNIWHMAGVYLFILCISGALYPLHAVNQNILLVKGEGKKILMLEIIRRSLMVMILIVTLQFDIIIFVLGSALYSIILFFVNLYFCGSPINYRIKDQLKDLIPIFLRFSIMVICSLCIYNLLRTEHILFRTIIEFIVSLIVGVFLFRKNEHIGEMKEIIVNIIRKK